MTRIRAVVFDLFGTLVPEFPLSVWEGMLDGMVTALGADRNAFRRAWAETVVERQSTAASLRRARARSPAHRR